MFQKDKRYKSFLFQTYAQGYSEIKNFCIFCPSETFVSDFPYVISQGISYRRGYRCRE